VDQLAVARGRERVRWSGPCPLLAHGRGAEDVSACQAHTSERISRLTSWLFTAQVGARAGAGLRAK
jgi:hypothetical protein